jgi:hypothetical protein
MIITRRTPFQIALATALLLFVASPALAGEGVITGVVKDSDGKPMAGVIVRAYSLGDRKSVQTEADGDGKFQILGVGAGENWITVQSVKQGDSFAIRVDTIEVGEKEYKLKIQLEKTEVCGKVTLKDTGKPAGSGRNSPSLTFHQVNKRGRQIDGGSSGSAYPDRDGSWRWRGFKPGRYRIYVSMRGYRKTELEVEVKKGKKKKGVDIVLEPLKSGLVRFEVSDEEGEPMEGVDFSVLRGDTSSTLFVDETDDLGVYETKELEEGTWQVSVHKRGYAYAHVKVKVKEGKTTEVEVKLKKD